jgi:peroxiredoxin
MVDVGDSTPDFTAPLANGDVEPFTLSENLNGTTVLAFFPGAFTSVCTSEMNTLQGDLDQFEEIGATLYGVSVDTPFALNEFREQNELEFGLISDTNKEIIDAYDVSMDFADMGYHGVAKRAVFILGEGEITYAWVSDDPGAEPDYDELTEAASDAA